MATIVQAVQWQMCCNYRHVSRTGMKYNNDGLGFSAALAFVSICCRAQFPIKSQKTFAFNDVPKARVFQKLYINLCSFTHLYLYCLQYQPNYRKYVYFFNACTVRELKEFARF